jgi:hypothetical protein
MTRTAVARALQSGVTIALSLSPPLFAGCGGQLETNAPGGGDAAVDASQTACGVYLDASPTRLCEPQSFPFHGTAAECDADFGILSVAQCGSLCPAGATAIDCYVLWSSAAQEVINCNYACTAGRRPAGLQPPSDAAARTAGGRLLAKAAYLEEASVHAFVVLALELEEHGAPTRLCEASLRAARDEIRHAAVMRRLAERAEARVGAVRVEGRRRRPLEAIAVENAVEGCVGEAYGAAVACMQAKRAGDPRFRAVMKRIAADETRHAELSFELARWFDGHLSREGRRRLRNARDLAVQALARSVRRAPDGTAVVLGLPTAEQATVLVEELRRSLWT